MNAVSYDVATVSNNWDNENPMNKIINDIKVFKNDLDQFINVLYCDVLPIDSNNYVNSFNNAIISFIMSGCGKASN